jgi:hypothetical protein
MGRSARNAFIFWFATALSLVGFIVGFNVVVDPFGYFGRNTIGYYFSSERQFKFSIVKSYDYNGIVLGDSRIAYTDTSAINHPEYTFVNGGIGGASVMEQVALLAASRLDRLRLAVFGLQFGDLAHCSDDEAPRKGVVVAPKEYGSWDGLRFAASLTQFGYAIQAVVARAQGRNPAYHEDGTRSVADRYIAEAALDGKTPRYWKKLRKDIEEGPTKRVGYPFGAKCRELLSKARRLADRHGFALMVVFLPKNGDVLKHLNWDTPQAREETRQFLAQVEEVVPHVVDLSTSSFSDSRNFWLNDSRHFKPLIGALVVQEAIERSLGDRG